MITTASITPCCKKSTPETLRQQLIGVLVLFAWWLVAPWAHAGPGPEVADMRLERNEQGLFVSAALQFALPDLAEDALEKGIPVHFVLDAQVLRERWYWSDKVVAEATRYLRLTYQPLTRRWRLNVSPTPLVSAGLGMALGQTYEDLDDALAAMQRVARWRIAEAGQVEPDAAHTVQLRFRLDTSQLPRPLQIGAVGRPGWNLLLSRSQKLPAEAGR